MTTDELNTIVAAVVAELEKSGVDFDYKAKPAEDGDLVFVIRGTAPNYQGVTVTWKGLLDIITAQATQAKTDAVTAKNAANTILKQVQSKGTEITNFVATSKIEIETQKNESVNAVKSVYQTDLNELKGDLCEIADIYNPIIVDEKCNKTIGYLNTSDGSFISSTNQTWWVTDFIEINKDKLYSFECEYDSNGTIKTTPRCIIGYDENKNFVENIQPSNYSYGKINDRKNISYIRINLSECTTLNMLKVYATDEGSAKVVTAKGQNIEVLEDKVEVLEINKYKGDRKATICFSLDGDYDMNVGIANIAKEHNYRIGLALSFMNKYDVFPISKYLELQADGHEIMNHSGVNVGVGSPYTQEEIAQKIKENYDFMISNGFKVNGFVAYQSNIVPSTIEVIKKYYDYGATEHNHYGDSESNMYITNSSPYHLWRYNMNTSTMEQMINAVDRCIETKGLLHFYGHADSNEQGYLTYDNFETLLSYIDSKGIDVKVLLPKDTISYFFPITNDYIDWETVIPTVSENYELITNNIKVNKSLGICNFNVRINSLSDQTISGILLSDIPKNLIGRFYLQTNRSALKLFVYDDGTLRVDKGESISSGSSIFISGTYLINNSES